MNCTEVLELAPLHLSGELEPARAVQVSAHLGGCLSCARELGQQQAFDSRLRSIVLAESVETTGIEHNVRQTIGREARRWMFEFAAVAAVLLLSVLGIRMALRPSAIPVYAAAARDHRVEIVDGQPRKWFTDRASIDGLARAQGVSATAIDGMASGGYHLARGKVCRLDGQFFLHLVYVNGAENFSVFVRHADGLQAIYHETQGAEHVAGFQGHQMTALIVTEQAGDAADRFARLASTVL